MNINSLNLELKFTKTFNTRIESDAVHSETGWANGSAYESSQPNRNNSPKTKRIKYVGINNTKFVYWLNH